MKNLTIFLIQFLLTEACFAQIPLEQYKTEIKNLKTADDIELYWGKLYEIDQTVLVYEKDISKSDSISIDLMIRTALLFQIHDTIGYNRFGNLLPVLNLAHSSLGTCQLIYWPIIEKCAKIGGGIESHGGTYPAYELETVTLNFYNFSLLNQELKYPDLLNKLKGKEYDSIVNRLSSIFFDQKSIYKLSEQKVIGAWINQPFSNLKEESSFEFVVMSDGNYYVKQHDRFQKLNQTNKKKGKRIFSIENEPFGWTYCLGKDKNLVLLDEKGEILIRYTKSTICETN